MPGEDIQKLIQAFSQVQLMKVEIQMQHKDVCIQANCESCGKLSELCITCFFRSSQRLSLGTHAMKRHQNVKDATLYLKDY